MKNRNFSVEHPSSLPRLLAVSEVTSIPPDRCISYLHQCWIINCGLIQRDIYFKAGTIDTEWKYYRCANLHLFRPGIRVWEDQRRAGGKSVHGLTVRFDSMAYSLLDTRFDDTFDFYEFEDHDDFGKNLIINILEAYDREREGSFLQIQALFLSLIDSLVKSPFVDGNLLSLHPLARKQIPTSDFAGVVHDYLRKHLDQKVTVKKLAQFMCISESHFYHRYKEETGTTLMQTLQKFRIETAKSLLIQGIPVQTIAEETGFYDAFHFSRAFKSVYRLSPRNFLKKYQSGS